MSYPRLIAWTAALVLFHVPASARAQTPSPREVAQARFDEGAHLYRNGDFNGALAEFTAAYEQAAYPVILFNIGLTYDKLGRPAEAVQALERVRAHSGTLTPERLEVARATLERLRGTLATVAIDCNVKGARVFIGGVERGTAPGTFLVPAGLSHVQVIAANHLPFSREMTFPRRGAVSIDAELQPSEVRLARLTVDVQLPDVAIRVDGELRGETPLKQPLLLLPGKHRVMLTREGYVPWSNDLDLVDDGRIAIDPDLHVDPNAAHDNGRLALALREQQALITVDGESRGLYGGSIPLPAGRHALRIQASGFFEGHRNVVIRPNQATRLAVRLDPTPETLSGHQARVLAFHTGGWASIAVGGALVVGGAITLGANTSRRKRVHDENDFVSQGCPGEPDQRACVARGAKVGREVVVVRTTDGIGTGALLLGTAGLGVGIGLLVAGPDADLYTRQPTERIGLRPYLDLDLTSRGGGLGVRGRF